MKKNRLSVVISTYNSEKKLAKCLDSVKEIADEIIIVNNSSTDKTESIAKKYTDKIFTRTNNPMLNVNKNFGFSKTNSEWILSLDDDEQVTPELAEEIGAVISREEINGYWIPRKNIIFGKWMEHTGWYPDYQLRLFRRGKGKFAEKHIHEMIAVQGQTEKLTRPMMHDNYSSIAQFVGKLPIYTTNEAEQLIKNGYELKAVDALRFPTKEFIQRYFVQQGYKDGLHGLVLSLLMGFYHLLVFAMVWEKKGFPEVNDADLLHSVHVTGKSLGGEINYWMLSTFIDHAKSSIEKIKLKVLRKRVLRQIKNQI